MLSHSDCCQSDPNIIQFADTIIEFEDGSLINIQEKEEAIQVSSVEELIPEEKQVTHRSYNSIDKLLVSIAEYNYDKIYRSTIADHSSAVITR